MIAPTRSNGIQLLLQFTHKMLKLYFTLNFAMLNNITLITAYQVVKFSSKFPQGIT